jgi:uncharacterized protein YdhG (YjbR/CyaY superfamily)
MMAKYQDVQAYIEAAPESYQESLYKIREIIMTGIKGVKEKIAWGMPSYYKQGYLIHFAIFKQHIGLYPGINAIQAFSLEFDQLALKYSKGGVQLPLAKELPLDLIKAIVSYQAKNG